MIKLVYLICWAMTPTPTDCHIVSFKEKTIKECYSTAESIRKLGVISWCNTGRKRETFEEFMKNANKELR